MALRKQNKKKKGFTLIELIIVIAIIAILAAIAIPNFLSIQRKSKVKADIASAKTIYDAASALVAEGKITSDKTFILEKGADSSDKNNIVEDYLQTIPTSQSISGDIFAVVVDPDGTAAGKDENNKPIGEQPAKIEVYLVKLGSADAKGGTLVYPSTTGTYAINGTSTN